MGAAEREWTFCYTWDFIVKEGNEEFVHLDWPHMDTLHDEMQTLQVETDFAKNEAFKNN